MSEEFTSGNEAYQALPADAWEGMDVGEPAVVWKALSASEETTLAQKVDFIGRVASEQRATGHRDFIARTVALLEDPAASQTVQSNYKIFDTFRRPAPYGLGWTLEQMQRYPKGRLRPFADKGVWTKANPEKVEAILNRVVTEGEGKLRPMLEPELRAQINEEIRAEGGTGGTKEAPQKLATVSVTVDESDKALLEWVFEAVVSKHASSEVPFSTNAKQRHGMALVALVYEWLQHPEQALLASQIPTGDEDSSAREA